MMHLIEAAKADDLMSMMDCIQNGYDVNFSIPSSTYYETPLHCAVRNDSLPAVKLLMSYCANMNESHDEMEFATPFCLAVIKNHVDILHYFIEKGADVNDRSSGSACPAIVFAAVYGSVESLEVLIRAGADVNMPDCDNQTAIYFAAYHGHHDIVKALKEAGACCDMADLGAQARKCAMVQ